MAKVTFETLNPEAPLFTELSKKGEYKWWEKMKNHSDLYIEIRKDNNINVYYQGGSVVKLHYCKKHKKIQAFTHPKYLGKEGKNYVNCIDYLDKSFESILENIRTNYSQKKGISKENWSEKYIQGNIIMAHRGNYIDSEFAYNDNQLKIRVDLVECIAGELRFVELKRIDDNRMVTLDMYPKILSQIDNYRKFISKYNKEILEYYQKLYLIKKSLGITIPFVKPRELNPKPKLLIFDRWVKEGKKRTTHREMMEEILEKKNQPKIDYSIINSLYVPSRKYYKKSREKQVFYYQHNLKSFAENGGAYEGKPCDFVLQSKDSKYNLWEGIREPELVINYFNEYKIAWWGENKENKSPSGHLVSSQIHCLNHLFALRHDATAIKTILEKSIGLQIKEVLPSPLDKDGYITFEFVYKNISLLGEKQETRGKKCTSIDALIYVKLINGQKVLIPIEWKYTETYDGKETREESFGRYTKIHRGSNCHQWTPMYRADPFYELMRQTLLVERIIKSKDKDLVANDYVHIVVCPNENRELLHDIDAFRESLSHKGQQRFYVIDPQDLLMPLQENDQYKELINYLKERYW